MTQQKTSFYSFKLVSFFFCWVMKYELHLLKKNSSGFSYNDAYIFMSKYLSKGRLIDTQSWNLLNPDYWFIFYGLLYILTVVQNTKIYRHQIEIQKIYLILWQCKLSCSALLILFYGSVLYNSLCNFLIKCNLFQVEFEKYICIPISSTK